MRVDTASGGPRRRWRGELTKAICEAAAHWLGFGGPVREEYALWTAEAFRPVCDADLSLAHETWR